MKKWLFTILIFLSALSLSFSSGYYSIFGLSKLFSKEASAVIIMATSLEFSKIVIASALHSYWNTLSKLIKIYLISALIILILITSMGIYGFLSSAYQSTYNSYKLDNSRISIIETKRNRFSSERDNIIQQQKMLSGNLNELQNSLVTNVNKKHSSEYNTKKIDKIITRNQNLSETYLIKLQNLSDSINVLDNVILKMKSESISTAEMGPLEYISKLTNTSMDRVVNILILFIIFVFDPLAIILVLLGNHSISRNNLLNKNNELEIENNEKERNSNIKDIIEKYKKKKKKSESTSNKISENIVETTQIEVDEKNNTNSLNVLPPEEKKVYSFTPNQIKNMPHQEVENFLKK